MMWRKNKKSTPALSIVVIFYDMPSQALNTLFTLSTDFQRQVNQEDYEVIAVENRSSNTIDEKQLQALTGNFKYFLRDESLPTPVHAINFGVEQASADHVCIMVDGARMVSPMLIYYSLKAISLYQNPVVTVPGYHLGAKLQQEAAEDGYDEKAEKELLASVPWREDGYRLFDVSCLSASSRSGFFEPIGESNTLTVSQTLFRRLGGFDTRFTETGGGQCNLDFYKRAVEQTDTDLIMLLGEGSFHQFHGGVTTGREIGKAREKTMNDHFAQYQKIRGEFYSPPQKTPVFLGEIHPAVLKYIHHSAQFSRNKLGELAYPDHQGKI
ncbi:MAG: glycosyl transferase [Pseudomonadales bacterium]|nr:glycosyl transferase [Pseudomonadales bacterium]